MFLQEDSVAVRRAWGKTGGEQLGATCVMARDIAAFSRPGGGGVALGLLGALHTHRVGEESWVCTIQLGNPGTSSVWGPAWVRETASGPDRRRSLAPVCGTHT